MRLVRLEAEVAAPLPVPASTALDLDAHVFSLRAQLQRTEEERDAALVGAPVKRNAVCRGQGRGGHHMPPLPGLIPGELTRWMEERHSDLQEALSCDDQGHCGDHIQVGRRSVEVERDHRFPGFSPTEPDHPK